MLQKKSPLLEKEFRGLRLFRRESRLIFVQGSPIVHTEVLNPTSLPEAPIMGVGRHEESTFSLVLVHSRIRTLIYDLHFAGPS